jgi:hypothetical protein
MADGTTYRIKPVEGPWGEYSAVLFHGIASWYQRGFSGELLVERMGPSVPAMTFPSGAGPVVTEGLKAEMEGSGLSGVTFLPVIKKHIVQSRYHEWDLAAREPKRFPRGGVAENYILTRPHSPEASEEMGPLWELRVGETAADLYRPAGCPDVLASVRTREFLQPRAGDWVSFEPA